MLRLIRTVSHTLRWTKLPAGPSQRHSTLRKAGFRWVGDQGDGVGPTCGLHAPPVAPVPMEFVGKQPAIKTSVQ